MHLSAIRFTSLVLIAGMILAGCAAAVSTAASPTAPAGASSSPTATQPAPSAIPVTAGTPAGSPAPASAGGAARWVLVPGQSEASYTVREQLARLSFPTDAVGKTNQVSGEIDIQKDGTIDPAKSKFVVDLASLQTDSSMRDGFVRRSILQTDQYPQAVFVPTKVEGLPNPLPTSGPVSFKITGDLTLHGVTKTVTWDVTGTANGGSAIGKATTSFTFEDFNLNQPQVPVVLSVVNHITLSLNLTLKQQ